MSMARQTNIMEKAQERITLGNRVIDTDHGYIHEGIFFEVNSNFSLNAAGTKIFSFTTPATGYVHWRQGDVSCGADKLTIELFEGSTITAETGSVLTAYNHNRVSALTAGMVVKDAPTVTAAGTEIWQTYIPGATGVGGTVSGALAGPRANEWVLKQNTTYTVKFTNGSASANIVQANFFWYEEESA